MKFLYIVWGILPFIFFCLAGKTLLKGKKVADAGRHVKNYLVQGMFCSVALALAIWIDKIGIEELFRTITLDLIDPLVGRWLLYPGILLLGAYANNWLPKKKKKKRRPRA